MSVAPQRLALWRDAARETLVTGHGASAELLADALLAALDALGMAAAEHADIRRALAQAERERDEALGEATLLADELDEAHSSWTEAQR